METEFKYKLNDDNIFYEIIKDTDLVGEISDDKVEIINMRADYFDTKDMDFRHNGIAYRIRHENDRMVATIKWDKDVHDGLHVREEFNLVVSDELYAENPDIKIFETSDAYEVLHQAAGEKKLYKTIDMQYERKQFKVDTGKSISCISVDKGIVHHEDGHELPILELEIEWYYGDEEDFKKLASSIKEKYQLVPENVSKLQRAYI